MTDVHAFCEAIRSAGLEQPAEITPDGKIHRFASNGKPGDDAGWYVFHRDGLPAGMFGCWRLGVKESWRANIGRELTPAERAAHGKKIEAMKRERKQEEAQRHAAAASQAVAIWKTAQPAPTDHSYLIAKGIKPHGVRVYGDALVIPMRDSGGELHSLQFIDATGGKRFLTGGRVGGCYYAIGNRKGAAEVCIAEGFATGATIHEATGYPVAVAFNCGNLETVARVLREKFADLRLIVCADDDFRTAGNPGLTKATAAARAVGGLLAVPDFGANRPEGATDFNDMAALSGFESVVRAIAAAKPMSAQRSTGGYNLVSASELLSASEPETRWIWDGVLPEGGMSLMVGKPKAGKSTFAFALSLAVAEGKEFLNRTTTRGTVVYLALEEKRGEVKKKLEASGSVVENLHFHFGAAPSDAITSVGELIRKMEARLLVIDVLQKFIRVRDLNDYALVTNALEPLLTAARESGCHVLFTHHAGKADRPDGDEVLGSTALLGGVDTLVSIKKRNSQRTFFTIQRYGGDIPETVIELHSDGRLDAVGNRQEVEIEEVYPAILEAMGDAEITRDDILERVERKRTVVLNALAKLCDDKRIERKGSGKKGDPFIYKNSVFPFPDTIGNGGTESKPPPKSPSQNELFRSRDIANPAPNTNRTGTKKVDDIDDAEWWPA